MEKNEIDVTTLSAKDLRIDEAQRLELQLNESIEGHIINIKAYKTDYGLLFNFIVQTETDTYSVSSWNVYITPRVENILTLKGKKVKVSNTGSKKYKLSS